MKIKERMESKNAKNLGTIRKFGMYILLLNMSMSMYVNGWTRVVNKVVYRNVPVKSGATILRLLVLAVTSL